MCLGLKPMWRALFVGAFLACASLSAADALAQTPLKLALEGRIEGPVAPLLVAIERGHFKAEGLDVVIEAVPGTAELLNRLTSGAADLAWGDINGFMRGRDQNAGVSAKAVFMVNNRPSYAIIGRKSRGVSQPWDLEGKKLGVPPAEPASALWPVFARLNALDPAKVAVVSVGLPVREPMLAAGELDAVTGASHTSPMVLRGKGVPSEDISVILMAEHGLLVYGTAIIAGGKLLAERPELLRGFLRALVRGMLDTFADPQGAAATVIRRNGGGNRDVELERLLVAVKDSMITDEVRANGLGAVDPARMETAIEQMATGQPFRSKPKAGDVFDPAFLPEAAERQLDCSDLPACQR